MAKEVGMTPSKDREATCHCGQLRIRLSGEPRLVSSCHCLACQRRTGALFGSSAFFARSQVVSIEGESRAFSRLGDSGASLTFHFCPTCGSNLYWENERLADTVCVAVGAFADPSLPRPARTVWTVNKHTWLAFPGDLPRHPRNPSILVP
jgi:hypothetical protein